MICIGYKISFVTTWAKAESKNRNREYRNRKPLIIFFCFLFCSAGMTTWFCAVRILGLIGVPVILLCRSFFVCLVVGVVGCCSGNDVCPRCHPFPLLHYSVPVVLSRQLRNISDSHTLHCIALKKSHIQKNIKNGKYPIPPKNIIVVETYVSPSKLITDKATSVSHSKGVTSNEEIIRINRGDVKWVPSSRIEYLGRKSWPPSQIWFTCLKPMSNSQSSLSHIGSDRVFGLLLVIDILVVGTSTIRISATMIFSW